MKDLLNSYIYQISQSKASGPRGEWCGRRERKRETKVNAYLCVSKVRIARSLAGSIPPFTPNYSTVVTSPALKRLMCPASFSPSRVHSITHFSEGRAKSTQPLRFHPGVKNKFPAVKASPVSFVAQGASMLGATALNLQSAVSENLETMHLVEVDGIKHLS